MELTTLREQTEKAKADVVVDFRASQPFIDACAIYYCDGFDNYLKQVGSVYPNLNLSKISMKDLLLTSPAHGDFVSKQTNNSTHTEQDPKDDGVVLAQLALERPIVPLVTSAEDDENPSTQDAQNHSTKDDENPPAQDAQNPSAQFLTI